MTFVDEDHAKVRAVPTDYTPGICYKHRAALEPTGAAARGANYDRLRAASVGTTPVGGSTVGTVGYEGAEMEQGGRRPTAESGRQRVDPRSDLRLRRAAAAAAAAAAPRRRGPSRRRRGRAPAAIAPGARLLHALRAYGGFAPAVGAAPSAPPPMPLRCCGCSASSCTFLRWRGYAAVTTKRRHPTRNRNPGGSSPILASPRPTIRFSSPLPPFLRPPHAKQKTIPECRFSVRPKGTRVPHLTYFWASDGSLNLNTTLGADGRRRDRAAPHHPLATLTTPSALLRRTDHTDFSFSSSTCTGASSNENNSRAHHNSHRCPEPHHPHHNPIELVAGPPRRAFWGLTLHLGLVEGAALLPKSALDSQWNIKSQTLPSNATSDVYGRRIRGITTRVALEGAGVVPVQSNLGRVSHPGDRAALPGGSASSSVETSGGRPVT